MPKVDLAPHQLSAVSRLHNGSILTGGVGVGKTRVAMQYYMEKERGKDILVITTAKKRDSLDWEAEAILHGISTSADTTFSGVLKVDSWNNLAKYEHLENCFVILDEQRLVGSGAWVKSFYKIAKNNNWIMLSATPGDTWMDYIPVFVAKGFYKNKTEFLREHVIFSRFAKYPKVERYIAVQKLVRYKNSILVDMPYERHTTRHLINVHVDYDEAIFKRVVNDRWNIYKERPLRDVGELFSVMRRVVNSDPSRVMAVQKLMEQHPRLIVFYNFDYELEMLRELSAETNIAFAEWNGHKHEPIPDTDRWVYFVQYTAGAEGWNCISTNAVAFYSLNYSWRIFEQCQGRIERMNTIYFDLYYYVLKSNSLIDKMIWKVLKVKESFNEKKAVKELNCQDLPRFAKISENGVENEAEKA